MAPDPGPAPSLAHSFRLFLVAMSATLAAVAVIYFAAGAPRTGSVAFTLFSATVVAWSVLERGSLGAAAAIFFYSLTVGITAFLATGYGIRDYGILGYPAVLFAGCAFLGARAYWGLAALVLASAGLYGAAELTGRLQNPMSHHVSPLSLATLLVILAGCAAGGRALMYAVRSAAARERELSGALRDSEATIQRVFRSSQNAISLSRLADGTYLDVNEAYLAMFGFERREVIGRNSLEAGIWVDRRDRERLVQHLAEHRAVRDFEVRFRRKSGDVMENLIAAEVLEIGGEPCLLSSVVDVTARREAERRAKFLSTRDALTGLPNRVLALDRLQADMGRLRREGTVIALVHADLDRFRSINESLGYGAGDAVLREAGARIAAVLRKGDTLARLGGDEFLVIAPSLDGAAAADGLAAAITGAFDAPIVVEGRPLSLECSAGMALFPDDSRDAEELLRHAESAMHYAKAEARGRCCRFDRVTNEHLRDRLFVEASLRQSIARGELRLAYQPKFDLGSRRITGLEALCRWTHPELGVVPPTRFIAIAEESDLIEELGHWVLGEACAQIARWRADGAPALSVAVNLSARQLTPALPGLIRDRAAEAGIDPGAIELEVTESMLIASPEATRKVLEQVAQGGSRIALDDFGVGYSSLNYIKHLPLDGLKIDRSFVRDIEENRHDAAIVTAIVTLAHGLGLRVVAEGIETEGQLQSIVALGCDEAQGYLLSMPLASDEVAARFLGNGHAQR